MFQPWCTVKVIGTAVRNWVLDTGSSCLSVAFILSSFLMLLLPTPFVCVCVCVCVVLWPLTIFQWYACSCCKGWNNFLCLISSCIACGGALQTGYEPFWNSTHCSCLGLVLPRAHLFCLFCSAFFLFFSFFFLFFKCQTFLFFLPFVCSPQNSLQVVWITDMVWKDQPIFSAIRRYLFHSIFYSLFKFVSNIHQWADIFFFFFIPFVLFTVQCWQQYI